MYTASEQQLLLAVRLCIDRESSPVRKEIEKFGRDYFCSFKLDWNDAFKNLSEKGDLVIINNRISD